MIKTPGTSAQFEQLVGRLLMSLGFTAMHAIPDKSFRGVDYVLLLGDERWAVEVKYYRTETAQIDLISDAASQLRIVASRADVRRTILAVSPVVMKRSRLAIEHEFGVVILDRDDLLSLASATPNLLAELNAILEVSEPGRVSGRDLSDVLSARPIDVAPAEPKSDGAELCQQLRNLPRGTKTWHRYEQLCEQVLKYLFPNDLDGWHKQKRTYDGLNRFDYVCRIRATKGFWRFLLQHLGSQYVLFEFKNYAGRIGQGQILSTEKYLLEKALRRVCIVLCRNGADKNATKMAQGAMRESGKLIIVVDDDDLCQMLHMKDLGEDPSDYLFNATDAFLLSLPR
jgi:hypothetical protein